MTGLRGTPCIHLHQDIKMDIGVGTYYCDLLGINYTPIICKECKPGTWCPLVGDKRFHIVGHISKIKDDGME